MPHGQDFHATCADLVDNPVVSFTNLTNFCIGVLWNGATTIGLVTEAVAAIHKSSNPALGILRLVLGNMVLDVLEP
jgi:hypothetical protein